MSGFYRLNVEERIRALDGSGFLPLPEGVKTLMNGALNLYDADRLVENVIGIYSLPLAVAPNFVINGQDRLVVMCIEEPSVVAAAANAARLVRESGGFKADVGSHLMTAQVELRGIADLRAAASRLEERKEDIVRECRHHSGDIESFGGGVKSVATRIVPSGEDGGRLVVHIFVDCADAMGANTLNTIAEKTSPFIAEIAGGTVGLRILTNLADRRITRASCRVAPETLALYRGAREKSIASGEEVRDLVIEAFRFADCDPYRAATHNKGIMNGVDAVVVATGNDWRAVEAGAHAMASMTGRYRPLSHWWKSEDGALAGEIRLPVPVGITGGMTRYHRTADLALKIMEVSNVKDLEMIVACTGLASNLAAMLALATEGIQRGHMRLHQRHLEHSTAGE